MYAAYEEHIFEACEKVGIDETSTRKRHNYFTIFVNIDEGKPIDIQELKEAVEKIIQFIIDIKN